MDGTNRIAEKTTVKEKTLYLSLDPANETNLDYTGDERSDIDKDCRGKGYFQIKKSDRKSRGKISEQNKHSDSSDLDESDSNDDRDDKLDRKKSQSRRR